MVEPWLRGTLQEVDAVRRQVLHALELAAEDCARWTAELTDAEINLRPFGMAPLAFHLRHIARSLDRLLTYAEGQALTEAQMLALRRELDPGAVAAQVRAELQDALQQASVRIRAFSAADFEQPRFVGRQRLPTTAGGLLVHGAEHTQRHVGQAISTAQVVLGLRVS